MLKKYIDDFVKQSTGSKEQLVDFLFSLKNDEHLLQELMRSEKVTLIAGDEKLEPQEEAGTFFGADFNLIEEETEETETFLGADLGLGPEEQETEEEILEVETFFDLDLGLDTESEDSLSFVENSTFEIDLNIDTSENEVKTFFDEEIEEIMESQEADFLGRYIDLGLLGKRGMGEVRKVRDRVLNRNLAMKIIHPNFLRNKNALTRFIEEAQVGAQLQHPNIVPIHELGTLPDGRYYFTMKEIKGREFTELIDEVHEASTDTAWKPSKDGTSFRRLIQIFHQICETMAFSHSLNVIHRDLKPENVMIGDYGEVLVVDWGIAKILGSLENLEDAVQTDRSEGNVMATRMGMVAGTPAYMSPEQAEGRVDLIGIGSDVYTLGAILYEILSGHPPYSGRTAMEIVEKVKTTQPPSLLTFSSGIFDLSGQSDVVDLEETAEKIPYPLIGICECAMSRTIEERYASAKELGQAVFDWLEGAQKRDRALKELEAAQEKLKQVQQLETHSRKCWEEANLIIQKNGFTDDSNWEKWIEGKETLEKANQLRQEYRDLLRDSLVYDFTFEEANEAMVELVLDDIISAVAVGEKRQIETLERQFDDYLQHLSMKKQDEFRRELQRKRNDEILLLRARRGDLVGRQLLREEITQALCNQSRLISLVGTAGVGKTRLGLEVIYDLQEESTQTFFCDLTDATTEMGVALSVGKAMDIQLRNIDPVGQLGELFDKHKTILVLDNLEQVVGPAGQVIIRWLEQAPLLRIIVTSRIKLKIEQEHSFPIQPLSTLEGIELFVKRGQKARGFFTLNELTRQIVGRIVTQLDNLPLAVELAAARLNVFSVKEIENRLHERFSLLRSREGAQALQGALDWSWDLLKPWAKAVLSQSSVFRGGFENKAAENIMNIGKWKSKSPPIFDILQDLVEDSLLLQTKSEDGTIRYRLMESIRQYAQSKLNDKNSIEQELTGEAARIGTQSRHAEYYAQFGKRKFLDSLDNQDDKKVWNAFLVELNNFAAGTEYDDGKLALNCCFAALKILGMKGPISLGIDIAGEVIEKPNISDRERKQLKIIRTRFLRISGRMKEARGERLDKKPTKPKAPPVEKQISSKESLAQKMKAAEQKREELQLKAQQLLEEGKLEQALEIFQELNDIKGIVITQKSISSTFQAKGDHNRALEALESALEVAEKNNVETNKGEIYSAMGRILEEKNQYSEAISFYQKAAEDYQRLENSRGEGGSLKELGNIYLKLGQYYNASTFFKQALQIHRELGDKKSEGSHLGNLGIIYQKLKQYKEAISYFKEAIEISRELGAKKSEAIHLGNIGVCYKKQGKYEEAAECYRSSVKISRELGNKKPECLYLGNLAGLYQEMGKPEEAISCFRQAIQILDTLGNTALKGRFLNNLGDLLLKQERFTEAVSCYEPALEIVRSLGNKKEEGSLLGSIGFSYYSLKDYENALKYFKQSVRFARGTGNKGNEGIYLGNMGEVYCLQEKWKQASEVLTEAVRICKSIIPVAAGAFSGNLAWAYAQQDELEKAFTVLKKGEILVSIEPFEYGKFLCKKAKVFLRMGQLDDAQEAFLQAGKIVFDLRTKPDSELGKMIQEVEGLIKSRRRLN